MLTFSKLSGSGNDFIIFDNRNGELSGLVNDTFVQKISARGLSVGADGVIFIEKSAQADFRWSFYNSDGSVPDMCGNGSRCAAMYAYINKIAPRSMRFETLAGIIEAEIKENQDVKVLLTKPSEPKIDEHIVIDGEKHLVSFIDTGVPHAVIFSRDITKIDVKTLGAKIRYHRHFAPRGVNVNFVQTLAANKIAVRTYERGVEDETLACGTGATAAALISIIKTFATQPVDVMTRSGKTLRIYKECDRVYLEGEARFIYKGELSIDGYKY